MTQREIEEFRKNPVWREIVTDLEERIRFTYGELSKLHKTETEPNGAQRVVGFMPYEHYLVNAAQLRECLWLLNMPENLIQEILENEQKETQL